MKVLQDKDGLRISCSPSEKRLLLGILESIRTHYQIKPADLDAKAASVWYSTRGCQTAGMTPVETRDWIENLFRYRSEQVQALTTWMRRLQHKQDNRHILVLHFDEVPRFLAVLNDHRLWQAARHDLGEPEMALGFAGASEALGPEQQIALCEVELLGYLMERVLACLPDSGSDWRNLCLDPEMD